MSRYLEKLFEYLIFIIGSAMVVVTFLQVGSRYLFGYSFKWAEEFARFGMVWTSFLGAAFVIKERGHTKVDFFIKLFPKELYHYINALLNLILIVFIISLIYFSIPTIKAAFLDVTPGLGIPYGYVSLALPVGGVLMIVYLLKDALTWLKAK